MYFVEQTKEIMYWKWNKALLADLIWTCGQHVLFHNIFRCSCLGYMCACAQNHNSLNFLIINWFIVKNVSDFKYCHLWLNQISNTIFFYPISLGSVALNLSNKHNFLKCFHSVEGIIKTYNMIIQFQSILASCIGPAFYLHDPTMEVIKLDWQIDMPFQHV